MPVAELLARTSGQELTDWMAYESLEGPLDPLWRGDYQAAVVATTVANAMRGKRGRKARIEDFLPEWGGREPQTWQEQLAIVEQLNRRLGGKDLRRARRDDAR